MYTSPQLRAKLDIVLAGADIVLQGDDYLDHRWRPHRDGRRFEYSTVQLSYAAALRRCISDLFLRWGPEAVRDEVLRLQDLFVGQLDQGRYKPLLFPPNHRSGILSLTGEGDATEVVRGLAAQKVCVSSRGGYVRIAPHFYNDDEEMIRAARAINSL